MYISGAKFGEHCFNISRDILDWVLYCFSGTTHEAITFLICTTWKRVKYLENKKRYSKKENAILLDFGKPLNQAAIIFLCKNIEGPQPRWNLKAISG